MNTASKVVDQLKEKGLYKGSPNDSKLRLTDREGNKNISNGVHTVKLGKDELVKINKNGIDVQGIRQWVNENGRILHYDYPIYGEMGENGKRNEHYLVRTFKDLKEGETVEMRFVPKGLNGYIDVRLKGQDKDSLPSVNLDDDSGKDTQPIQEGENEPDISGEDNPFVVE